MNGNPPSHLAVTSNGSMFRDFHDGIPLLMIASVILFFVIMRWRR